METFGLGCIPLHLEAHFEEEMGVTGPQRRGGWGGIPTLLQTHRKADPQNTSLSAPNYSWEQKQDAVSVSKGFCGSHGLRLSVPAEFLLTQQAQPICCHFLQEFSPLGEGSGITVALSSWILTLPPA